MIRKILKFLFINLTSRIWFLKPLYETLNTTSTITIKHFFWQKILRINSNIPWPVHKNSVVTGVKYIEVGFWTAPGASFGNYIFADYHSPITVGSYTIIAQNVCLAGYSHDLYDHRKYISKGGIKIGDYCWIAANSSIMPGVILGNHTSVAANTVVTKSFSDGYCVLGGNPAKIIKKLEPELCVDFNYKYTYKGYKKIKS